MSAYCVLWPVAKATSEPCSLVLISPPNSSYPSKMVFSTAVPLVAVSIWFFNPSRPPWAACT